MQIRFLFLILLKSILDNKAYSSTMKEESEEHSQTWMSFVANDYIWEAKQIPEVKKDLALLATIIAKYEPVSLLVYSEDRNEAIEHLNGLNSHNYPITRENIEILQNATDANGNPLEVIVIDNPDTFNESFGTKDFASGGGSIHCSTQ